MSRSQLRNAVVASNGPKRHVILQKLFAVWFDALVYNQIWEDPRVDLEALAPDGDSRILTISSGGCNALNYLLEDPRSVTAVDLNRSHIYLLTLKIAAVKTLPSWDDLFLFFGRGKGAAAGALYQKFIAPELDRASREFWGSNSLGGSLLYGDRISFFRDAGLYGHSRNGYFLRFFHWLSRRFGLDIEKILDADGPEEQIAIFEREIDPFFDNFIIRLIGRLPITVFGLGIPPQQYEELKRDLNGRTIIDLYRQRVRRLACDFPIRENYFAWQAFARRYDTKGLLAVPEYLKPENYARLKQNIGRLTTAVGSATDVIRGAEAGEFNRFVFLDAQDWMDRSQLIELWAAVADHAEPGSRIIFRTAGTDSPLERSLPPELLQLFEYEKDLSASLHRRDRAAIYGGFHLYVKRNGR